MSEPETWDRPTTSTRDLADLGRRLAAWLGTKLAADDEPRVANLEIPGSTGMSSETVLFDVTWNEGGAERHQSLVARVAPDPSAVPVFPVYDMGRQFQLLRLVAAHTSVPVPPALWSEPGTDALGAPFFVMERVDGVVPPDVMPYNFGDSWLYHGTRDEQTRLQEASVAILADLHAIEPAEKVFAFLEFPHRGDTHLRRFVADLAAYYEWAREGIRVPLVERCFRWLEDHWPSHEGPTALSWGDSRIGNVMYRDFEPVAVLDWEMAALTPREVDLSWMVYLHRFFEDMAAKYGMGGMPHFMRREDVFGTYAARTGYELRDGDWYMVLAALRYAIVSIRTTTRSVHFGEQEMPEDIDDIVMHRQGVEQMLQGAYWQSVP